MGDMRIEASLGLNAKEFEAGLEKAGGIAQKFSKALDVAVGSYAIGKMTGFIKSVGDMAEKLLNTSETLGVSTDFLQDWTYTADMAGVGAEAATLGIEKLSVKIGQARDGSKEAQKEFSRLGISLTNADGTARSTEDVLRDVAAAINETSDGAERASMAIDFFGKGGVKLLPLISQIGSLQEAMNKFSNEQLRQLDDGADAWEDFQKTVVSATGKIIVGIGNLGYNAGYLFGGNADAPEAMDNARRAAPVARRAMRNDEFVEKMQALLAEFDAIDESAAQKVEKTRERIIELDKQILSAQKLGTDSKEIEIKRQEEANKLKKESVALEADNLKKAELITREKKKTADWLDDLINRQSNLSAAEGALESARADRLRFSETELQDMSISRRRNPALWNAQQQLWRAQRMEDEARGLVGIDKGRAEDLMNQAEALRAGIEYLKESDRLPFKSLQESSTRAADNLDEIWTMFTNGTAKTQVLGGK